MNKRELNDFSVEELKSKMRILRGVLIIMSILVFFYLVYFGSKLISGTWQANNMLGIVMLVMLVVIISNTYMRYSKIARELKTRNSA